MVLVALAGCSQPVDSDGDGLNRTVEKEHGLDDQLADTDSDGLNDSYEFHHPKLDPTTNDTDDDGLHDNRELELGTDPSNPDSDNDGIKDGVEMELGADPLDSNSDSDGVPDGEEYAIGTSLTSSDTDGDGLTDDVELADDRLSPTAADTDSDGLSDSEEERLGTKPHRADTDGDGLDDGTEHRIGTSPLKMHSDSDELDDGLEREIGTDPTVADTDGDGRADHTEYRSDSLDPLNAEVQVVDGSPEAGLSNASLQKDALQKAEFLSDLPEDKAERERLVTRAATETCNGHNTVATDVSSTTSDIGDGTYRNTYRVSHAAGVMSDLGADIEPRVIDKRMRTAREVSGVAAKYAPVIGSYQRLHEASCAVKADEPGAQEDFYIASAAFTVDLALAQQQVVYKAAFKTTGTLANQVGLMRLARTCGYKCVGMVESEMYWLASGTYSGAIDQVAIYAMEGNLTADGINSSSRQELQGYLGNKTGTRIIEDRLVPEEQLIECVTDELSVTDVPQYIGELSGDAREVLRTILSTQSLPEDTDLSFLTDVESVNRCIQR